MRMDRNTNKNVNLLHNTFMLQMSQSRNFSQSCTGNSLIFNFQSNSLHDTSNTQHYKQIFTGEEQQTFKATMVFERLSIALYTTP